MASVHKSVLVSYSAQQLFALAKDACKVELTLNYECTTHALETLIGPVFNRIADSFIDAFVKRAESVYAA